MFYSFKNIPVTIDGKLIFANSAGLSIQNDLVPCYVVGKEMDNNFAQVNSIVGSLKLNYYLTGRDSITKFIPRNEYNILNGNVAGLAFSSGYLSNYTLSVSPNNPLTVDCEILFFDPLQGAFTPSNTASILTTGNFLHANYLQINSLDNSSEEIADFHSLTWSFRGTIRPEYYAQVSGSGLHPNRVYLGERDFNIQFNTSSTNLDLPASGKHIGIKIGCLIPGTNTTGEYFVASGRLINKTASIAAGRLWENTYSLIQNSDNINITQSLQETVPTITNFSPEGAEIGSNTLITVWGTNLQTAYLITVGGGGQAPPYYISVYGTSLSFYLPEISYPGPIRITTRIPNTTIVSSNSFAGTYPNINIDSVSSSILDRGEIVTVIGENFLDINKVTYNGTNCSFNLISDTELKFAVPEFNDSDGPGDLCVISTKRNKTGTYIYPLPPKSLIYSVVPEEGAALHDEILIKGRNFVGSSIHAYFSTDGGAPVEATILNSSTTGIRINIPWGARESIYLTINQTTSLNQTVYWNGTFRPIAYATDAIYDAADTPNTSFTNNQYFYGYAWNLDPGILDMVSSNQCVVRLNNVSVSVTINDTRGGDTSLPFQFHGYTPTEGGDFEGNVEIGGKNWTSFPNPEGITIKSYGPPVLTNISPPDANFYEPYQGDVKNSLLLVLEGKQLNDFIPGDTQAIKITGQWPSFSTSSASWDWNTATYYIETGRFTEDVAGNKLFINMNDYRFSGTNVGVNTFSSESPYGIFSLDTNTNPIDRLEAAGEECAYEDQYALASPDAAVIPWNTLCLFPVFSGAPVFDIRIRNLATQSLTDPYSNSKLSLNLKYPTNKITSETAKGVVSNCKLYLRTKISLPNNYKNYSNEIIKEFTYKGHKKENCLEGALDRGFKQSVVKGVEKFEIGTPYVVLESSDQGGFWEYTFGTAQTLRFLSFLSQDKYHTYRNLVGAQYTRSGTGGQTITCTLYPDDAESSSTSQSITLVQTQMSAYQGFWDTDMVPQKEDADYSSNTKLWRYRQRFKVTYYQAFWFFAPQAVKKIKIENASAVDEKFVLAGIGAI